MANFNQMYFIVSPRRGRWVADGQRNWIYFKFGDTNNSNVALVEARYANENPDTEVLGLWTQAQGNAGTEMKTFILANEIHFVNLTQVGSTEWFRAPDGKVTRLIQQITNNWQGVEINGHTIKLLKDVVWNALT